ncbi:MAG: hypothetical protein O3C05_01570 [Proteobacteria bacterium]|nr:hypothetical protein [Pseudomonadota bacterium]
MKVLYSRFLALLLIFQFFIISDICSTYAFAIGKVSDSISVAESKENARKIGQNILGTTINNAARTEVESNKSIKEGLNYKGTSSTVLPEKNMNALQIEGEATHKKNNSKEASIIESAFYNREDHDIAALSKSLDGARDAQKNPENHVNFLGGSKDCEEIKSEDFTTKEKYICDEYASWKDTNCKIGRVVKVDAKHKYQCEIKRDKREGTCEKTLKAWCEGGVRNCGYNAGGIEEGSVDTGIEWEYSYPNLRLGSKTGSWHFNCGSRYCCSKTTQIAKFKIKDLNQVKKFTLKSISYDDHAMITINGATAHNTLGGYFLRITDLWWGSDREGDNDRVVTSGSGKGPCWRLYPKAGLNHYDYVGKDLRSFLKEGDNIVEIQLVYAQKGQVNVVFEAEQYCCTLKEEWEDECAKLKP